MSLEYCMPMEGLLKKENGLIGMKPIRQIATENNRHKNSVYSLIKYHGWELHTVNGVKCVDEATEKLILEIYAGKSKKRLNKKPTAERRKFTPGVREMFRDTDIGRIM